MVTPGHNICHFCPYKFNTFILGTFLGCIKIFTLGPDIHIVNSDIRFRVMLFGYHGLLDRIHTANRGAVTVITADIP